ncbi:MAG: hypothetical protein SFU87_16605 [Chitinophagaceae bacterium]|nr:hypothetical protein [Chitinophagaceae bacterium]
MNLERFARDNRESFDDKTPSSKVWDNIASQITPATTQKTKVVRMNLMKWSVAASVLLAVSVTAVYLFNNKPSATQPLAQKQTETPAVKGASASDPVVEEIDPQYAQMMVQFASMIENKQAEIKAIEKEQPELYKQFSADVTRLDSAYQVLRSTLPANPNKEQLLQAMIQNLQMQIDLLNQQLIIIQKFKQPKTQKI